MADERYAKSIAQLEIAKAVTPNGSQTYSKSYKTLPAGIAPLFASRTSGGRIWDIDGNEYVDLINGLASVNLGYGDPEIKAAVIKQLDDGVTISLSHPLEAIVSQQIIDLVHPGLQSPPLPDSIVTLNTLTRDKLQSAAELAD